MDFLHELIQRLDDSEYKFVMESALTSKGKPAPRVALITDLRKQKEYNQQLLKPKYNNYDGLRFQVRQLVMQALRVYHESNTIDQRISIYLQNERILYAKGIYEQAERELAEAQKLAETHHKLGRLLEILQLKQLRIMERQTQDLPTHVADNFDHIFNALRDYQEQLLAFRTHQQKFAAYRTIGKTQLDEPVVVTSEPKHHHFFRDFYRLAELSLEAQVSGDLPQAIDLARKTLALYDDEPKIKEELIVNYKIQRANLGVLLAGAGQYGEVEKIIRDLNAETPLDFNDQAETFQNTIHLELLLMINRRQFIGQNSLIQRVEQGLKDYGHKINTARKFAIWYNLFVLYFVNENYRQAKAIVEQIINHKRFDIRKEVQYTTRLLCLIIFYELNLWHDPDNAINAARRFLERNDQVSPFKDQVLRHLQRLMSVLPERQAPIFQELEAALQGMAHQEDQSDSLGLALVAAWTRSKLSNRSIKDSLQGPQP